MRQINFLPLFGPVLQNMERHPSPHFFSHGNLFHWSTETQTHRLIDILTRDVCFSNRLRDESVMISDRTTERKRP